MMKKKQTDPQPGPLPSRSQTASGWKLVLAYDGTDFHGWQVQPGRPTVQGLLSDTIERITGERVLPQGSGRTDAGVHALGQVATFILSAPIPPPNLLRALNRALPSSVRVLSAEVVSPDFHARHHALSKTYEYRIYRGEICPPWQARYVYALHGALDLSAMRRAADLIIGEHDFASFAASDPDLSERLLQGSPPRTTVRTIFSSLWEERGPELLVYRVQGTGFLHHMVRNLVGTFLEVGRGRIHPERIPEILAVRSRRAAGPTAPARGLWLVSVNYEA
jgi:tRNA pseudouridine38-40 synthase